MAMKPNKNSQHPNNHEFGHGQDIKSINNNCELKMDENFNNNSRFLEESTIYTENGIGDHLPITEHVEQWPPSTDTFYFNSYDDNDIKLHTKTYQTIDDPYCLDNDLKSIIEELFPMEQEENNFDLPSLPISNIDNSEYPGSQLIVDQNKYK